MSTSREHQTSPFAILATALAWCAASCGGNGLAVGGPDLAMSPACAAPRQLCGPLCVDVQSDLRHCGACGAACPPGNGCKAGRCTSVCAGRTFCPADNTCVDVQSDPLHCGSCDQACEPGQRCKAGACGSACPIGLHRCGMSCVDLQRDDAHCGSCAVACAAGSLCKNSACKLSCQPGLTDCGAACVDLQSDESHCGDCTTVCGPGERCTGGVCGVSCLAGAVLCPGGAQADAGVACTDTRSDPLHCGDCTTACAPGNVCSMGACALSCQTGYQACGGGCADLQTDANHCGDCTTACAAGLRCVGGRCARSCAAGLTACTGPLGSACVDLQTDRAHCGSCAASCGPGRSCSMGQCVLSCGAPLIACQSNTVCVDARVDPANCGSCGVICAGAANAMPACTPAGCSFTCNAGYVDCDGVATNGCEARPANDPANCGRCGNACPQGAPCTKGMCGTPTPESVLIIYESFMQPPGFSLDVQSVLMATSAFTKVDLYDASTMTPALAQLMPYTCALVFSMGKGFASGSQLGDTLYAYFLGGGRVVIAGAAFDPAIGVGGLFASMGLTLASSMGLHQLNGVTFQALEPTSPLLIGVQTFTAAQPYTMNLTLAPGTVVTARWSTGDPLVIRGVVNGRKRADLSLFPMSATALPGAWVGDGGILLKNLLLYK